MLVGILSMQRIINYGSFMQAYGLKKTIESLGNEVHFVDYHPGAVINIQKSIYTTSIRRKIKDRVQMKLFVNLFKSRYLRSLGITSEYNYDTKVDVLVIGSDEVFNCFQSNPDIGYTLELFGENSKAAKTVSYAASFGNTTFDKIEKYGKKTEIQNCLQKLDQISVRDKNSYDIVAKLCGSSPKINIDPVLLYDFSKDPLFNRKKSTHRKKYILLYAYAYRFTKEECDKLTIYANRNKLYILLMGGPQHIKGKLITCSPYKVLGYFENASAVITDTFHGTIFSVITHSNFSTITRKSTNGNYGNEEKLIALLGTLGLKNRIVTENHSFEEILGCKPDYHHVDEVIIEEREKSLFYIRECIE